MTDDRTWRDAKLPQWVNDSILSDMREWELTAALAWPTEAKPAPLPFQWGDYDRCYGEPREGVFWSPGGGSPIHIKQNAGKHGEKWKSWAFSYDGEKWGTTIKRGPLFDNEHDARLYALWCKCEEFAEVLLRMRRNMK